MVIDHSNTVVVGSNVVEYPAAREDRYAGRNSDQMVQLQEVSRVSAEGVTNVSAKSCADRNPKTLSRGYLQLGNYFYLPLATRLPSTTQSHALVMGNTGFVTLRRTDEAHACGYLLDRLKRWTTRCVVMVVSSLINLVYRGRMNE
jgi:hypothetical protein